MKLINNKDKMGKGNVQKAKTARERNAKDLLAN